MLIPANVIRLVEKQLRARYVLEARAEQRLFEAQQRAVSIAGPPPDKPAVQSSGQKSRVEVAVFRILQAEEQLDEARKWIAVFRLLDRAFPRETPEWKVANLIYQMGKTQKQAALELKISENTAAKYKDSYLCHAALMAAADGLIKIREERVET